MRELSRTPVLRYQESSFGKSAQALIKTLNEELKSGDSYEKKNLAPSFKAAVEALNASIPECFIKPSSIPDLKKNVAESFSKLGEKLFGTLIDLVRNDRLNFSWDDLFTGQLFVDDPVTGVLDEEVTNIPEFLFDRHSVLANRLLLYKLIDENIPAKYENNSEFYRAFETCLGRLKPKVEIMGKSTVYRVLNNDCVNCKTRKDDEERLSFVIAYTESDSFNRAACDGSFFRDHFPELAPSTAHRWAKEIKDYYSK